MVHSSKAWSRQRLCLQVCALTQALETTLQDTRLALALRGGSIHTHRNADAKQTRPACVSHLLPATSEEVSDEDKTDLSHPSHLSHQHLHHNVHTVTSFVPILMAWCVCVCGSCMCVCESERERVCIVDLGLGGWNSMDCDAMG